MYIYFVYWIVCKTYTLSRIYMVTTWRTLLESKGVAKNQVDRALDHWPFSDKLSDGISCFEMKWKVYIFKVTHRRSRFQCLRKTHHQWFLNWTRILGGSKFHLLLLVSLSWRSEKDVFLKSSTESWEAWFQRGFRRKHIKHLFLVGSTCCLTRFRSWCCL